MIYEQLKLALAKSLCQCLIFLSVNSLLLFGQFWNDPWVFNRLGFGHILDCILNGFLWRSRRWVNFYFCFSTTIYITESSQTRARTVWLIGRWRWRIKIFHIFILNGLPELDYIVTRPNYLNLLVLNVLILITSQLR